MVAHEVTPSGRGRYARRLVILRGSVCVGGSVCVCVCTEHRELVLKCLVDDDITIRLVRGLACAPPFPLGRPH